MKKVKIYAIFCNETYTGFTTEKKIAREIIKERNFDRNIVWEWYTVKVPDAEFNDNKSESSHYHNDYEYFFDDYMLNKYVNSKEEQDFVSKLDSYLVTLENTFSSGLNGTFYFLRDSSIVDKYNEIQALLYALIQLCSYRDDADEKFIDMIEDAESRFMYDEVGINADELWEEFISEYIYPF